MSYTQKFHKDDLVRIARVLPAYMQHFPAGRRAYILYSYEDGHGPHSNPGSPDYAIEITGRGPNSGFHAWYPESTLKLVKRRRRCPCCKQFVRRKRSR